MGSDPDTTTPAAVHDTISIHAPRMGSDSPSALPKSGFSHFNPRSPDGERLPVSRFAMPSPSNFNPRSPDGERRGRRAEALLVAEISIHAPRMGSDDNKVDAVTQVVISIHAPRMGSDRCRLLGRPRLRISIHAPRMGSDRCRSSGCRTTRDFNPRSPDGERLVAWFNNKATHESSIHAPRMGSDFSGFFIWFVGINFNPRSPDGERQVGDAAALFEDAFQSTLPGWGATGI